MFLQKKNMLFIHLLTFQHFEIHLEFSAFSLSDKQIKLY